MLPGLSGILKLRGKASVTRQLLHQVDDAAKCSAQAPAPLCWPLCVMAAESGEVSVAVASYLRSLQQHSQFTRLLLDGFCVQCCAFDRGFAVGAPSCIAGAPQLSLTALSSCCTVGRSTVWVGSSRLRICLPSQESQFSIVLLHVSCRVNEEAPLCLTLS